MELKLEWVCQPAIVIVLLIVPYGIETGKSQFRFFTTYLLIVPYGIETILYSCSNSVLILLIVPYGIETSIHTAIQQPVSFF